MDYLIMFIDINGEYKTEVINDKETYQENIEGVLSVFIDNYSHKEVLGVVRKS